MYAVAITVLTVAQLSLAQMGFGGGGYCASCALKRQGMTSPGFGFGGGAGVQPVSTTSQIQSGYGTTFGDNFGYTSVSSQLPAATIINTGLPNTFTTPFTIPTTVCPTGKCNCNSGVCTSCNSCGWNKVAACNCASGNCNCNRFNSYQPWATGTSVNNVLQGTYSTLNTENTPFIQPFNGQQSTQYVTDNSFSSFGYNANPVTYGASFSSMPKTSYENFNYQTNQYSNGNSYTH